MAQLIVYINSEQKASAYYINSYLSFHGARYDANLTDFSEIVQEELDHSVGEKRDEISVLIVSNGATNETVRTVISNLLNTENEEGILNVNFQELNVIEAKYFLPMLGNPETPEAEDFARFFEFKNSYSEKLQELENLTSEVSTLKKTIEEKDSEISELQSFKELVLRAIEKKREKQTIKADSEINKKIDNSNRICKINFGMDCKEDKNRLIQPNIEDIKNSKKYGLIFHRLKKDQSIIKGNSCIGTYKINISSVPIFNIIKMQAFGEIPKKTKRDGKIFYVVENGFEVKEGDVVAVIGDEDWTTKDVVECLKRNSYNNQYVKNYENTVHPSNCENNPLIYDAETH